jgi:hypothetical protein
MIASPRGSLAILNSSFARVHSYIHLAAAVVAVCAIGMGWTPARADSVTATFSNVNPGEVVTIPVNGGTESGWAGVYNFINASGYLTGSFSGFCIDISQDIFTSQTVTFGVAALASAPVDGNLPTAMGALRAELIAELWYNDYALIGTSNSNAAAFQLAIWEIINETQTNNGTLVLNIDSGTFYATDQDSPTLAMANTWLGQLSLNGTGLMASGLVALTNSTYQDYVFQDAPPPPAPLPTPAPPSLVLCLIGAVGLLFSPAFRWLPRGRRHFLTP